MNPTQYPITVGTASVLALAQNPARTYLEVNNKSNDEAVVKVKIDGVDFIQAANGVQKVTFSSTPDSGDFQLSLGGEATGLLAFSHSAAQVQADLEALSTIGAGNVSVAGSFADGFTITFQGSLAAQLVAPLTVASNTLADSTKKVQAVHTISFSTPPTAGAWRLTWEDQETEDLDFDISAAELKTAIEALSVPPTVVSVVQDEDTKAFTITLGVDSTLGAFTVTENTLSTDAAQASSVQTIYAAPTPVSGSFKLMFGAETTVAIPYNVTAAELDAFLQDLPSIDADNVSVTGASLTAGLVVTFQNAKAGQAVPALIPTENNLAASGVVGTEVGLAVVQATPGAGTTPVSATPATTTLGVNADTVTPVLAVTAAGNTQPNEGLEILAGESKTWQAPNVPIEAVYLVSNVASTPVEVVEG